MLTYLNILIPVILKILVPDGRYGVITIVVDFIILPLSLIILNIYLIQSKTESLLLKCFALMLVGSLLGNAVGYIIWGISSKNLMSPDAETLVISKAIVLYHIAVCLIFAGIYKVVLLITKK